DIADIGFVFVAFFDRLTLDDKADRVPAAGEWDNAIRGDPGNSWKGAKPLAELFVETNRVRILGIGRRRKIHGKSEKIRRIKTRITIQKPCKALDHQGRADQEHQREGDLRYHEDPAKTCASSRC